MNKKAGSTLTIFILFLVIAVMDGLNNHNNLMMIFWLMMGVGFFFLARDTDKQKSSRKY